MKNSENMIESPPIAKRDRLSAFFAAFELSATMVLAGARGAIANLVVVGSEGSPESVVFCSRSNAMPTDPYGVIAAATIEFGGTMNPLMNAMPERCIITLGDVPVLEAVTAAFVSEASDNRCGRQAALNRLCEVIVLMILRRAVDIGSAKPGLLAGLSHPTLHRAIVAVHDEPSRPWRTEDLATICGMSRSRFMTLFPKVVGVTPAAYVNSWRLTLGHRELQQGMRVKQVARRMGFGSSAAFSRAYSRAFGWPPVSTRGSNKILELGSRESAMDGP